MLQFHSIKVHFLVAFIIVQQTMFVYENWHQYEVFALANNSMMFEIDQKNKIKIKSNHMHAQFDRLVKIMCMHILP